MEALDYIDFAILGIILLFTFRGFLNGFSKEFCSLLGIIVGVAIASRYAEEAGKWAKSNFFGFDSSSANTFFGFIAVFFMIWIASLLLSHFLVRLINSVFSKYINSILGGIFGAIKSYLVLAILLYMGLQINFLERNKQSFIGKSYFYPYMEKIASKIVALDLSPEGIKNHAQDFKETLENKAQETFDETKDTLKDMISPQDSKDNII